MRMTCLISILLVSATLAVAQDREAKEAISTSARNFSFKFIEWDGPPEKLAGQNAYTVVKEVHGINDAGMVVGTLDKPVYNGSYSKEAAPFTYENGKFTLVRGSKNEGRYTIAVAVNNRGQVLLAPDPKGPVRPGTYFLYDMAQKTFSPVGVVAQVAGAPDKVRVNVTGFNDSGQFVGSFNFHGKQYGGYGTLPVGPAGSTTPPVEPGSFVQLACPDGRNMNATSLNNHGQVTGSCGPEHGPSSGFLYSDGEVTLFKYPDADLTIGYAINDAGAVVGLARINPPGPGTSETIGFAYDGSQFGAIAVCADLSLARGFFSAAYSVNNKGAIVGTHCGSSSGDNGFVATATGKNPLRLAVAGR